MLAFLQRPGVRGRSRLLPDALAQQVEPHAVPEAAEADLSQPRPAKVDVTAEHDLYQPVAAPVGDDDGAAPSQTITAAFFR